MPQLYHALKLLSYRMRRYPLWIVVVSSVVPLYLCVSWTLRELPWTSSQDAWTSFVRLDDHTFLKQTIYLRSGRRGLSESDYADKCVINLTKKTYQRLPFEEFHAFTDPVGLSNGSLVVKDDNSRLLIVDPNTLESMITKAPASHDSIVNGRYAVHCDGNKLYSFDLLNQSVFREQDLLLPGSVSAVEGSPHAIVTITTWDALDLFLSTLPHGWVVTDQHEMESMDAPAFRPSLYDIVPNSWQLVTLYAIDEEGPHWVTSWIASTLNHSSPTSSHGLIESISFDQSYTEIREASSAKIIAKHPIQIRNQMGAMFFSYGLNNGVLDYRSRTGHILIDPRRPGKVLGSCKPGTIFRVVYSANRLYYCCPKDEDPFLYENSPGTLEFYRRDTNEQTASWKGSSWLGRSTPLGFADNDEDLWVTDDEQTFYKVNMLTGEVLDQFHLHSGWHWPLLVMGFCASFWCLAYVTACSQLRIPYPLAALVLLWLAWNLCSLRLESVGNPNFTNRLSNQSLIAILCFGVLLLPIRILPAAVSRLSTCLTIGFIIMCETILVCRFLYDHYSGIEYQILTLIVGCTLLAVGIVVTTILKLKSRDNQRKPWQLSLAPALFWIAVCSLVIATFTFPFKTAKPTNLEPWLGLVRFFLYPTLGLGIWQILQSRNRGLLFKVATSSTWSCFIIILFAYLNVQKTPAPYFFWELSEKLFIGCYAAIPTTVLVGALSMPFPLPIRRWCKRHLIIRKIHKATG